MFGWRATFVFRLKYATPLNKTIFYKVWFSASSKKKRDVIAVASIQREIYFQIYE